MLRFLVMTMACLALASCKTANSSGPLAALDAGAKQGGFASKNNLTIDRSYSTNIGLTKIGDIVLDAVSKNDAFPQLDRLILDAILNSQDSNNDTDFGEQFPTTIDWYAGDCNGSDIKTMANICKHHGFFPKSGFTELAISSFFKSGSFANVDCVECESRYLEKLKEFELSRFVSDLQNIGFEKVDAKVVGLGSHLGASGDFQTIFRRDSDSLILAVGHRATEFSESPANASVRHFVTDFSLYFFDRKR